MPPVRGTEEKNKMKGTYDTSVQKLEILIMACVIYLLKLVMNNFEISRKNHSLT